MEKPNNQRNKTSGQESTQKQSIPRGIKFIQICFNNRKNSRMIRVFHLNYIVDCVKLYIYISDTPVHQVDSDVEKTVDVFSISNYTRKQIFNMTLPVTSNSVTSKDLSLVVTNEFDNPLRISVQPPQSVLQEATKMLSVSRHYNGVSINGLGKLSQGGLQTMQRLKEAVEIKRKVSEEKEWLLSDHLKKNEKETIIQYLWDTPVHECILKSGSVGVDPSSLATLCKERYVDNFIIDALLEMSPAIESCVYVPSTVWSWVDAVNADGKANVSYITKKLMKYVKTNTELITMVVHLFNSHWGVVVINTITEDVYFDEGLKMPLPASLKDKLKSLLLALGSFNKHIKSISNIFPTKRFNFPQQPATGVGSSSCGIAAVLTIQEIMKGLAQLPSPCFGWDFQKMNLHRQQLMLNICTSRKTI